MKTAYFKRLTDNKEFMLVKVKNNGLEGIAKDGEGTTLKFTDRTVAYLK